MISTTAFVNNNDDQDIQLGIMTLLQIQVLPNDNSNGEINNAINTIISYSLLNFGTVQVVLASQSITFNSLQVRAKYNNTLPSWKKICVEDYENNSTNSSIENLQPGKSTIDNLL